MKLIFSGEAEYIYIERERVMLQNNVGTVDFGGKIEANVCEISSRLANIRQRSSLN